MRVKTHRPRVGGKDLSVLRINHYLDGHGLGVRKKMINNNHSERVCSIPRSIIIIIIPLHFVRACAYDLNDLPRVGYNIVSVETKKGPTRLGGQECAPYVHNTYTVIIVRKNMRVFSRSCSLPDNNLYTCSDV